MAARKAVGFARYEKRRRRCMRFVNSAGKLGLDVGGQLIDVHERSAGRGLGLGLSTWRDGLGRQLSHELINKHRPEDRLVR